jgi:hypothetical protein
MSMPLSLEWTLVTEGKERRREEEDNHFTLTLEGYRLYPLHERIEIRRHQTSDQIGFGEIKSLTFTENKTEILYQLVSLYSVN